LIFFRLSTLLFLRNQRPWFFQIKDPSQFAYNRPLKPVSHERRKHREKEKVSKHSEKNRKLGEKKKEDEIEKRKK
jgi:hypothetical protein